MISFAVGYYTSLLRHKGNIKHDLAQYNVDYEEAFAVFNKEFGKYGKTDEELAHMAMTFMAGIMGGVELQEMRQGAIYDDMSSRLAGVIQKIEDHLDGKEVESSEREGKATEDLRGPSVTEGTVDA